MIPGCSGTRWVTDTQARRAWAPTVAEPQGVQMRVMVLGGDGYLGWPTAMYLSAGGHEVAVLDNAVRRQYDEELGSGSLVPIESLKTRVKAWERVSGERITTFHGDLCDAEFTYEAVQAFRP